MFRFFLRTFWYDRAMHAATMCGVAIATAILVGALLIGHSMRESLGRLTLDRLGNIGTLVQGDHFFSEKISPQGVPFLFLPTAADKANRNSGQLRQTGGVQLLGITDEFVKFWPENLFFEPSSRWKPGEVVINRQLADQLEISSPGESLTLHLMKPTFVPAESLLGHKQDLLQRIRVTVRQIIPDQGVGAFAIRPDQQKTPTIFVPLAWFQKELKQPDQCNAVAFEFDEKTMSFLKSPADLGLLLDRNESGILHVKSAKMVFSRDQASAVEKVLRETTGREPVPSLLYLAESLKAGNRETPYSTVVAMDWPRKIADDEIIFNRWTADDLQVTVGDFVELVYFEPESLHGEARRNTATFRIAEIIEIQPGTFADDPQLVPELPGLTDSMKIGEWNPPFPFDLKKIRDKDEQYWEKYRAVPKAFVSLKTGQKLWGSRFGNITAISLEQTTTDDLEAIQSVLAEKLDPSLFGLVEIPVRELGLKASSGTTPFSVLFLAFSFFIIVSALMLLAMLFRLAVEVKSRRLGIMMILGFTPRRLYRLFLAEGLLLSMIGGLIGVPLGIVYARVMIGGLNTWWVGAIVSPFLRLFIDPASLLLGFLLGACISFFVILLTVWRLGRLVPQQLLSSAEQVSPPGKSGSPLRRFLLLLGLPLVVFGPLCGGVIHDEQIKILFFFGFALVFLCYGILVFAQDLFRHASQPSQRFKMSNLWNLAVSNASRAKGRSLLTIALLAVSSFLILSVGAFRLDPVKDVSDRFSGTGGFVLVGETTSPVYYDINTESGRYELGLRKADEEILDRVHADVKMFRVRRGDQAGCLNLYQPNTPRILGVPASLTGFAWATKPSEDGNPWNCLNRPVTIDPDGVKRVSIVLENNTAMYSLHLYGGIGETIEIHDDSGNKIRLEVAGLLANSVFQGEILMSEKHLLAFFPEINGYHYFLVAFGKGGNDPAIVDSVKQVFYRTFSESGLTIETTKNRLSRYFAVQNTYLSTFQSLGGLGLFLGTLGLGVVQIRNILQRRKELALMQAIGFSQKRLFLLLAMESLYLLGWGLLIGLGAAFLAIVPQLTTRSASMPWVAIFLIFLAGLFSGTFGVRYLLRIPISAILREDF